MPGPLKDSRQERYCQFRFKGLTQDEAYKKAGYKPNRSNASQLNSKQHICDRVAELHGKSSEKLIFDLHGLKAWHERVMTTPIAQITPEHDLAQEVKRIVVQGKDKTTEERIEVKMPAKMDAAKELARLHGWGKEVSEVGATSELGELLLRIRGPGLPKEPKPVSE